MADSETVERAPVSATPSDVEVRARSQGWRPKEEFRGDPERWRPADEFLRNTEEYLPLLRKHTRTIEAKLEASTAKIDEMTQVLTAFRDFASRGEQRAYERARAELQAKREVAVSHADTETFKAVDRELAELEKTVAPKAAVAPPPPATVARPETPPEITQWVEENPWFNSSRVLGAVARELDAELMQSRPGLSLSERLSLVKTEVQRRFPDKFENPNREAATSVSAPSGNQTPRKAAKKSYENLPPEAKKACDKFVKTIPGFKVDDYVRDYDWGNE
jgi:hypothetical protein